MPPAEVLGKVPVGHEIGSEIVVGKSQKHNNEKGSNVCREFPVPCFIFPQPEITYFGHSEGGKEKEKEDGCVQGVDHEEKTQEESPGVICHDRGNLVFIWFRLT